MKSLWEFKNSPERLRRAAKWDLLKGSGKHRPLFLNRSGGGIKSKSITNAASKVVEEQLMVGQSFDRGFHDLRATFATSLARFMLEKHLPLGFIQYKLMALMGHENFSSTLKYINFARSVTFESQMEDWVNRIFSDLNPTLSAEAKTHAQGVSA